MSKNIIPIGDKVMLTPVYSEEEEDHGLIKKGGIIVPQNAQLEEENPIVVAKVVGVGDECKIVKIGDEVVVNRNNVHSVKIGILGYWFIQERILLGVMREKVDTAPACRGDHE